MPEGNMRAAVPTPSRARMGPVDRTARLSLRKKAGFSLIVLLGLLLAVELALRAAGVTFYPHAITLTHESDRELAEVPLLQDKTVQWVVTPNTLPGTPLAVNSHGMRGRGTSVEKPPGKIRILCLGDSCTFGARSDKPYPVRLEELCREQFGDHVEVLNGAVPGHAAHQGTAMLERYLKFSPDIVTVYFGWNDHWYRTAALQGPRISRPPVTDHLLILRGLRLAYHHWRARLAVLKEQDVVEIADSRLRLPPMHYLAMLDEFAVLAGQHAFDVVYLTAPSALTTENLDRIVQLGWADCPENVIELHDRYNEISREMAQKWNATLVDLAVIFARHADEPLLHWDGIHLSPKGHELAARALFEAIAPILRKTP